MTTEQKLHAVETAIRKALPRLLEQTEGCYFFNKLTLKEEKLVMRDIDDNYILLGRQKRTFSVFSPNNFKKMCDIIGHEILLSDVLEWLEGRGHYCVRTNGMFLEVNAVTLEFVECVPPNDLEYLHDNKIKWDLSKSYLKDQSEELINFLYDLIKE